jgi:hypothetical protein
LPVTNERALPIWLVVEEVSKMSTAHTRLWLSWLGSIGLSAAAGAFISSALPPLRPDQSGGAFAKAERCLPRAEDGTLYFDPEVIPTDLIAARLGVGEGR